MKIRQCAVNHHDIHSTLTFDPWRSNKGILIREACPAITFLPFKISQWYFVWVFDIENVDAWPLDICVGYQHNICLHFDPNVKYLAKFVRAITFKDRSMIFGIWMLDHQTVCHISSWHLLDLWPHGQIIWKACLSNNFFVFQDKDRSMIFYAYSCCIRGRHMF